MVSALWLGHVVLLSQAAACVCDSPTSVQGLPKPAPASGLRNRAGGPASRRGGPGVDHTGPASSEKFLPPVVQLFRVLCRLSLDFSGSHVWLCTRSDKRTGLTGAEPAPELPGPEAESTRARGWAALHGHEGFGEPGLSLLPHLEDSGPGFSGKG